MKLYQLLLSTLLSAAIVLADNAHFVGTTTASCLDGVLKVCFHEAGLGTVETINYEVSGTAVVERTCFNPDSHKPPGLQRFLTGVTAFGSLSQTSPGQITGCISTSGGQCAVPKHCPPPMTESLTCKFTGIKVTDLTNHVSDMAVDVTC
jgi:hypothetical protein